MTATAISYGRRVITNPIIQDVVKKSALEVAQKQIGYVDRFAKQLSTKTVDVHPPRISWIPHWLFAERNINGIKPRKNNPLATVSAIDPKYQPSAAAASFPLNAFNLPKQECRIYQSAYVSPGILKKYLNGTTCLFPVHPQTCEDDAVPHIEEIRKHSKVTETVVPTASSRTLYVDDTTVEPHCIKTHTPYAVTRSIRHLYERKLYSIPLSDDIEQYVRSATNPWFSYLPEVFGVAFGSSKDAWGYLVREMTPRPFKPETRCLVPLFSLYCPDKLNPHDDPLLVKMIEASGMDPKKMILEHVLFPLIFCWTDLFEKRGIIHEAHGQNTLVDISDRGVPRRLVFRDFDNYVLGSVREQLGLSNTGLECGLFDNEETDYSPKGGTFSLLYDQAMRVPFDEIADLAEKHYGISRAELQKEVRGFFRSMFPAWQTYFPSNGKAYNYASGVLTPGVKPKLVEAGIPEWR